MNKFDSYEISEYTKDKMGYLRFENCTILFQNPTSNEYEVRIACVEIFGRAIKASIQDNDGHLEYIYNHFANGLIECIIVAEIQNDCFWLQFNNVIMLANENFMSVLEEYAMSVEEIYESYYSREYEDELMKSATSMNNDTDINNISSIEFELLCKQLIDKMGFETEMTKASGDGGIDIIAYNHQPLLSGKFIIQCKKYSGSVGEPIIRDLYGVVMSERANKGILITTGYFTKSAINFARDKQIELIAGDRLSELLNTYQLNFQNKLPNFRKKPIVQILENAITFDLDGYNDRINTLLNNPNDEITRVRLIQQLMGCVLGMVPDIDTQEDKLVIFSEIKRHIELYSKHFSKTNKKTQYMNAILKMVYIQLSFLEGDFTEAFKKYVELINQRELHIYEKNGIDINPDLMDKVWLVNCLYSVLYDMVQISLLADDDNFTERIFQVGKDIFSLQQTQLYFSIVNIDGDLTDTQVSFAKKEYEKLEQIKTFNSLYLLDEYIISECIEYVYYNALPFPYAPDSYPVVILDNKIIIQDCDKEYCIIDNWEKSIANATRNI